MPLPELCSRYAIVILEVPTMYACLLLLVLVAAEAIAIRWWLRREWLPFIFNDWAVLIYSALFALDLVLIWLASLPFSASGVSELGWLPILGIAIIVVVFLFTLFFRWVLRQDSIEPPPDKA